MAAAASEPAAAQPPAQPPAAQPPAAQPSVAQQAAAQPSASQRVASSPASAAPAASETRAGRSGEPPRSADFATEVTALEPAVNAARAAAQRLDQVDLGTTSITGNQELPKVLYIVPWKRSDLGDLVGRPVNTLLDEVLSPVDPDVFKRHLEYYDELFEPSAGTQAGAGDRKE
jgi:hypothetical protein